MKLKIWQAGEPVLRQKARPVAVEEITTPTIQALVEAMAETMRDAPGVGLAAPQVGVPLQLAVIEDLPEYIDRMPADQVKRLERVPVPFHVIINPKLIIDEWEPVESFEGCLSVAGYSAIVPRARKVRAECWNEKAEAITIEAHGWYARILQHEIDHLHGFLYVDRMKSRSLTTLDNYLRNWKDRTPEQFWAAVDGD
ncbi:MAG: peptide deformylase [Bryobacterales bacterium]|nr:peptide deformylase [Bryobacterales bacterium]